MTTKKLARSKKRIEPPDVTRRFDRQHQQLRRKKMEKPVDKETAKEQFRSSRLSWSNQAEHKLRQELNDIAIAKCKDVTEKFALCAMEHNLLVVFKCRSLNKAMNDCLHQFTGDEQFQAYREKRAKEVLETL